jgi:5-methylcytosine-specific restriction endonuclease McrA
MPVQTRSQTKKEKVLELFKPNDVGVSEWISRDILDKKGLVSNNGNQRHSVFFRMDNFIWETKRENNRKTGKILAIKMNGYSDIEISIDRPIKKSIKKHYKKQPCCACGSTSSLECDHKNDLYNDERVLNTKTQTLDDFQSLCAHCNSQKRQVNKKMRETGKRYGATNIPMLKVFGIDFIEGDETYDPKDINAMVGTFWYDPIEFMKKIKEKVTQLNQ